MGCAQVTRPGSETRSSVELDSVRQTEVGYANWKGKWMNDETTYDNFSANCNCGRQPLVIATAAGWQPC